MKKQLAYILLSALVGSCKPNEEREYLISDLKIMYIASEEYEEIDSVVYVIPDTFYHHPVCDFVKVYFDQDKNHLAYESYNKKDTCYCRDYWRNGNLKHETIYLNSEEYHEPWPWFKTYYCKNGQVLFSDTTEYFSANGLNYVNYHCNGIKKNEFYYINMKVDGLMTEWYENGNIWFEVNFNLGKAEGTWTYFKPNGDLDRVEIYHNNELIEEKKY